MKALLSQWIGGSKANSVIPKSGSGAATSHGNSVSAEKQSFMGLMMGFLGMGQQQMPDESTSASFSGNAVGTEAKATSEADEQQPKSALQHQGSFSAMMMPAEEKIKGTYSEGINRQTKEKELTFSATNTGGLQQPQESAASENETTTTTKVANTETPILQNTEQDQSQPAPSALLSEKTSDKKAANALPENKEQVSKDLKQATTIKEASVSSVKPSEAEISEKSTAQSTPTGQQAAKETKNTPVKTDASIPLKELMQEQKNPAKALKKNQPIQHELVEKLQKKSKKEAREPSSKKGASHSLSDTYAAGSSAKKSTAAKQAGPFFKTVQDASTFSPAKATASVSGQMEIEASNDDGKDAKSGSNNAFKEIHFNDLKSTQLAEAAGRKTFSRQLVRATRPQLNQTRENTPQNAQWKHHRFILKDGSSIHIAARSADGGLQLQLNAGNSELGKMLHQHLQDIQQHVQQELNIEIDLQLQHSGGQQAGQQEEPSSAPKTGEKRSASAGGSGPKTMHSNNPSPVRYLGFNRNEWTA